MDIVDWIFFGPTRLLAALPYAGLAIAAMLIGVEVARALATGERFSRHWLRRATVFAGLLWVIFTFYEWQMSALMAQTASPMLRLDLMVLTPVLYALTVYAVYTLIRRSPATLVETKEDTN
jgi:hypothetical protein